MSRDVLHMVAEVLNVVGLPVAPVPGLILPPLQATDAEALGTLMRRAYRGTIDDDDNEPGDALADAARTLAG